MPLARGSSCPTTESGDPGKTAAGPTSLQRCILQGGRRAPPPWSMPTRPTSASLSLGCCRVSPAPVHERRHAPPQPPPQPPAGRAPAWHPGRWVSPAPEDPHPSHRNKSAEPRRPAGSRPSRRAPAAPAPPSRLPRCRSLSSCTTPFILSGQRLSGQASAVPGHRLPGSENNGAALCASSAQASFVPPFPPARLPLAQGHRLPRQPGGSVRKPRYFHSLQKPGGRGLGQSRPRDRTRIQMCAAGCRPARWPQTVPLPEPPHRGYPTRAPTGDPQRKWGLSSHLLSARLSSAPALPQAPLATLDALTQCRP